MAGSGDGGEVDKRGRRGPRRPPGELECRLAVGEKRNPEGADLGRRLSLFAVGAGVALGASLPVCVVGLRVKHTPRPLN